MNNLYKKIDDYYTTKINTYGATPKGVDWNSEESQFVRFKQLSRIINSKEFDLADVGCGYGKYYEYLLSNFTRFNYFGYDFSKKMIEKANHLYNRSNANFKRIKSQDNIKKVNYIVASGIYSVKMEHSEAEWLSYILDSLDKINKKSLNGFSFNMLTKYSDKEYMRGDLFYADPLFIFDFCKRNFSDNVALLHDYGLYEFTVLVRKEN